MAAILKISDDFYEDTFTLIALHSSLEDFALAYRLNLFLKSNFKRCRLDLDISQNISFPIFEWKNLDTDGYWTLIANHSFTQDNTVQESLFQNEPSYTAHFLLPEYKDVDYFLKIEEDNVKTEKPIVEAVLKMPEIVTAYSIQTNTIKSINNLIY
ncbi:IPExxxVDY family protein [Costertonia aggregata]|uniref:IPExxxVDY family protein n=1 Tax=Costertonia aggregata TaxID=343403 RepID=A0A7H9AQG4_9FLAO|nr:IPExxxVDY family protein [Costertonia aggregata]QLG45485.1 IPExxxVDY family protein [Costertonia aggregata]